MSQPPGIRSKNVTFSLEPRVESQEGSSGDSKTGATHVRATDTTVSSASTDGASGASGVGDSEASAAATDEAVDADRLKRLSVGLEVAATDAAVSEQRAAIVEVDAACSRGLTAEMKRVGGGSAASLGTKRVSGKKKRAKVRAKAKLDHEQREAEAEMRECEREADELDRESAGRTNRFQRLGSPVSPN